MHVVVLMGLPGAGKSTLAEALAPAMPARIVSRDEVRAAMFRPCSFTDEEKVAAFEALLRAVGLNCELGHSTIVDGMPFSRAGEYEAVKEAGVARGAAVLPVLCSVPVEEAQRRVSAQVGAAREAAEDRDEGLVAQVAARFDPPPYGTVEIDGTRPVEELVDRVLGHVRPAPARM